MTTEAAPNATRSVRGQALRLAPHPDHCDDVVALGVLVRRLRAENPRPLLAADLFAGAGGMSLGLEHAGMRVVFGADFDRDALATHAHHFGGMSVGWDLGDPENVEEVGRILRSVNIDVIAGGPPCQPFSKAGRSRMRYLVQHGVRETHDRRKDLWQSYLEVVRTARPRAVIMENVPDMALDREMFILRSIVRRLEDWGYSVQERVVDTYRYGVPQFRQRLILVALHGGLDFTWPEESTKKVTLGNAIRDLPEVDPQEGWMSEATRKGWRKYGGPQTEFQRDMRAEVPMTQSDRVYDHVTRRVRDDDAVAFEQLDTKTRYSELPDELKRYRDDIFDDKYKRLDANDLSRTITAHIAKDGYWYIHPEQNRTLTIREAARIQTFPDHFRFAGGPTSAFRQIGNAVPPRLARAMGAAVAEVLGDGAARLAVPTARTRSALANWGRTTAEVSPWLRSRSRWLVVLGDALLGEESTTVAEAVWPILSVWNTPEDLIANAETLVEVSGWLGREDASAAVLELAQTLTREGGSLDDARLAELVGRGLMRRSAVELAMIADPEEEEPVIANTAALRVAGRFFQGTERWLKNRNSDGRIAVGRLIGFDEESREAQIALIELGARLCTPKAPDCDRCPLSAWCRYGAGR
ncbi:DNA (cytosine-5-)-methyltransferase [Nocardioides carbamazepini]|uniref:DNA (cytosine-5-)-methyltransferase n=1 Tax=Nocardioides carbamazepini TaxID=2854259 RepID=UPI002149CC1A|nr:DNA (cytosine-5-)-methyltransferase [Nocardioides carbamazepini]MCR1785412.1 DNA (cytosine-5-)-methyltransferase [Nocardioides carbamazepini]